MRCDYAKTGGFMSRRKKIQERMQQLNITQQQIARYVMLPVSTVTAWMLGAQDIPYGSLWKLCELLNLDLHEVLEG